MKAGSLVAAGVVVVSIAGLAACSDDSDEAASNSKTVQVKITNDGCTATPGKVNAGAITFEITNTDATAVSEVELIKDNRILAERENIAPGIAAAPFSHNLGGGTYTLYCPGATNERTEFTVVGETTQATGAVPDLLRDEAGEYKTYVNEQVDLLVGATKVLVDAVHANNLQQAKDAYPKARPFYERIEPVAGSFCDDGSTDCSENAAVNLDAAIDAREDSVPPGGTWQGFHVLEKQLFSAGNLDGMGPVADTLMRNVNLLKTLVSKPDFTFAPADIINGAGDLLDEVSTTKLTGEEERYAHIDILDMQANIEGSEQAFGIVRPALQQIDPQLTQQLVDAFAKVDELIDGFRDPSQPGGFKLFDQVADADKRKMAEAIIAVKDPLAQAGGKIAAAG
ncbi:MAG: peptidase M75 family protein [Gordonia sp. (in: high G+C Gram-positive bacteria)]